MRQREKHAQEGAPARHIRGAGVDLVNERRTDRLPAGLLPEGSGISSNRAMRSAIAVVPDAILGNALYVLAAGFQRRIV